MLTDVLLIGLNAFGIALIIAGLTWIVQRRLRHRSVTASVFLVVAAALLSVVAGVSVVGVQMFLSEHDLFVALIVVGCAAVVSFAMVAVLTRGLRRDAVWADELRARERRMESSRRELVAWVSHDIRTPLAGIRAMAEALEDGVVQDQSSIDDYYRKLRQEAGRMSGLVDDLFELSRINAGALKLDLHNVDLSQVLSDAVSSADPLASARGVRLRIDPLPMTRVIGSERELSRVAHNLLANAIHFTPPDGTVAMDAGIEDGRAWFTVTDCCGGIPEPDLPRVFDVAFRGEPARNNAAKSGGGLGLAIARGLVEAHRGSIDVRNEGLGCRVTVSIPAS